MSTRAHHRGAVAVTSALCLLLALAACGQAVSPASDGKPVPSSSSPALSSPAPSSAAPSRPTGSPAPVRNRPTSVAVDVVASYSLTVPDAGSVTTAGSGIAFTTTINNLRPNQVETVNIMKPGDRTPTVVFTGAPGGAIEGVVAGKNYLVWTFATQQEDPMDEVPWTIYAYDLHSGTTRVVARSREDSPLPPWSSISGNQIAWPVYRGMDSQLSDFYVADLGTHHTRKVASGVRSGQLTLSGTTLIYNKTVVVPTSNDDLGKSDLFALDLRTGKTRRLTHTGRVELPTLSGPWLAWQAGHKLGSMNLATGATHTLNIDVQGFLSAGPGFAAYMGWGNEGVSVVPLADRARPIRVPHGSATEMCVPCGITVSGSRMTWAADRGHNKFQVWVGDVHLHR